jgi:transcriptional regulator with XRE-family HTH domain
MNERNTEGAAGGGRQITRALTGLGFTPATLARALGVSRGRAARMMNNTNAPSRNIAMLAALVRENAATLLYQGPAGLRLGEARERPKAEGSA